MNSHRRSLQIFRQIWSCANSFSLLFNSGKYWRYSSSPSSSQNLYSVYLRGRLDATSGPHDLAHEPALPNAPVTQKVLALGRAVSLERLLDLGKHGLELFFQDGRQLGSGHAVEDVANGVGVFVTAAEGLRPLTRTRESRAAPQDPLLRHPTHYLFSLSFFRNSRTLVGLISARVIVLVFLNSALTASTTACGISVFSCHQGA